MLCTTVIGEMGDTGIRQLQPNMKANTAEFRARKNANLRRTE